MNKISKKSMLEMDRDKKIAWARQYENVRARQRKHAHLDLSHDAEVFLSQQWTWVVGPVED